MAYLFTAITLWVITIATATYLEHLAFSKKQVLSYRSQLVVRC